MYALYVCLIRMPYTGACHVCVYVCLKSMPSTGACHVCVPCMARVSASIVCPGCLLYMCILSVRQVGMKSEMCAHAHDTRVGARTPDGMHARTRTFTHACTHTHQIAYMHAQRVHARTSESAHGR